MISIESTTGDQSTVHDIKKRSRVGWFQFDKRFNGYTGGKRSDVYGNRAKRGILIRGIFIAYFIIIHISRRNSTNLFSVNDHHSPASEGGRHLERNQGAKVNHTHTIILYPYFNINKFPMTKMSFELLLLSKRKVH